MGKSKKEVEQDNVYLFLDLDETIITREKRTLIEPAIEKLLPQLLTQKINLYISSRNPPYIVVDSLKEFNLEKYFKKLIVDYRNKKYHIKEILVNDNNIYNNDIIVVFIDDHKPNCLNVNDLSTEIKGELIVIQFTRNIISLMEILESILNQNYNHLRKIAMNR